MAELDFENSLHFQFGLDLGEREDQLQRLVFDLVRSESSLRNPTKDAMALLIGNLLRCSAFLEDGFLAYPRNHNAFGGPGRYREVEIGHRALLRCVEILEAKNLVQNHPGFHRPNGEGKVSRLEPQSELFDLLEEAELLGWAPKSKPPKESLILRAKNSMLMDYVDGAETRRMRNELLEFNEMLSGHQLALPGHTGPLQETFLVRIFNRGDFALGGRHYRGWWQYACEKEDRANIEIDGEPTIELDYSGLHIYLLYAEANQQYSGDPYAVMTDLSPEMRKLAKLALLIAINAPSPKSTLAALRNEANGLGLCMAQEDLEKLLALLSAKHEPIRNHFMSDAGIRLQGRDSKIMAGVLNRGSKADIPILPVHDSLICRERDMNRVESWMRDSYEEETGFEPEVKCKGRQSAAREWREARAEGQQTVHRRRARRRPRAEDHGMRPIEGPRECNFSELLHPTPTSPN